MDEIIGVCFLDNRNVSLRPNTFCVKSVKLLFVKDLSQFCYL